MIMIASNQLKYTILWLLVFANRSCCLEITEEIENLPVSISRGADVSKIDDVVLFTDAQFLIFTLPDLPDPPATSSKRCTIPDDEACMLYNGLQVGVNDISELLSVINRILTTKGLNDVSPESYDFPSTWINTIAGVSVTSNMPSDEVISKAGEDWFDDTEARLTLRQLLTDGPDKLSIRQRRWVSKMIKPALHLAKVAGLGDIADVFHQLFVGDNSILAYLTSYRAFSKKEYKVFADLPRRVSELQTETKKLFLEVLNSTEIVKTVTSELQDAIDDHAYKLATIEESFLMEQNTISDIIRSLYTSVVYSMHFAAYEECRASQLPTAFVPPKLLHQRLLEVEGQLPENVRFAIPVRDFQLYYRMPLTECLFDSQGGIIQLSIPLVEKSANMQLYEFKAIHFAHEAMTCTLQTPSSTLIKDVKNNRIFAVTEIDEENCQPKMSGLCRVPFATADDSNNFCLSILLSGEPTSVVKEACPLKCFPDERPLLSQISDAVFVGVHLPSKGVKMVCPGQTFHVDTTVPHGAIRFTTVCDCIIFNGNKTLGRSTLKYCDSKLLPKIDIIMPVHMTTLSDLLPFFDDGSDSTVFGHAEEIYNPNFSPRAPEYEDALAIPFRVSAYAWNFLQSLFMGYLYVRLNNLAGTLLAVNNIPIVAAAALRTCDLPNDAYIYLWIIIGLCSVSLMPGVFRKLFHVCQNVYNEHILAQAHQLVQNA